MYLNENIVKEGNETLRNISKDVSIPLSKEDIDILTNMHEYLVVSGIDELVKKYKIRPGVGIAAPQVGYNKRMFCIEFDDFLDDDNKHYSMAVVNPKIIAKSKEMTYLPGGEGCLSVDRQTSGVTPRHYKIIVKTHLYDFVTKKLKFQTLELEGYPAIVFQHEYDHLDGILFVDKMYEDIPNAQPLYTIDEDATNE